MLSHGDTRHRGNEGDGFKNRAHHFLVVTARSIIILCSSVRLEGVEHGTTLINYNYIGP